MSSSGCGLRPRRAALPSLGLALLCASCSRLAIAPAEPGLRDSVTRGPLTVTTEVQPAQPRVGDTLLIHLSVVAPDDCLVQLPPPAQFGELKAREEPGPESLPGESGVTWRRSYRVEIGLSGPLEIPALTIAYQRRIDGETQPAALSELATNPLKLQVATALVADEQPTSPRDITGILTPPVPPVPLWVWLLLGAALAVAGAAAALLYRAWRARALRPPPPLAPEVRARRALRALEESGWITGGRAREFYYRLTEIVRNYIEEKFGLAAPEMTTAEFLATLVRHHGALPYDRTRLQAFLEACDFVKYAALQPQPADALTALHTARAFVDATAAAALQPAAPATTTTAPPTIAAAPRATGAFARPTTDQRGGDS